MTFYSIFFQFQAKFNNVFYPVDGAAGLNVKLVANTVLQALKSLPNVLDLQSINHLNNVNCYLFEINRGLA